MPGFNINEFKSNVLRNGLLKNNLYLVNFDPKANLGRTLFFYTTEVITPFADLDPVSINRYGYGPTEQVVYRPVFSPLTIDFMAEASEQSSLILLTQKLNSATNFMYYNDINSGGSNYAGGVPNNPYEVEYKDKYTFDLEIYVYNEAAKQILTYSYRDCFVKSVGQLMLSWAQTDQLLRVTVTFSFTDFSIYPLDQKNLSGALGGLIGGTAARNQFSSPNSYAVDQTLLTSAIRIPRTLADSINVNNAGLFFPS